jgi:hypothetical protein
MVMKTTGVTVSRSVRVNLGNYESADFFVSMTGEPDEGQTRTSVARTLRKSVDESLIENLSAHFKARGKALSKNAICQKFGFKTE